MQPAPLRRVPPKGRISPFEPQEKDMTETTRHDRIFLQVCDDDGEYERRGDITWCQDRIHDTDVEYIRKELHDQQLAASQAMQCTSPFDYSPPCRGIQRVKDELANATKQNVLLRGLIDHILNTYHVPRVPRITEALDATADLAGLVVCAAEPVAWLSKDGQDFSYQQSAYFTTPLYEAKEKS
jgi:hypothetical protein